MQGAQSGRLRVLIGIAVVATALLSVSPASTAVTSELVAEADTYVSALQPDGNRGDLPELKADDEPIRNIFLRFAVSGVTSASVVELKVWVAKKTRNGLDVRSVNGAWEEMTVTYANAPPLGPVGASSGALPREDWVTIDVSSLVRTNGPVSLALTTRNRNSITLASREAGAGHAPRLIVTNPDPEPPPPPPLSPFTVTQEGTVYHATSAAGVTYSGTLESAVEAAARHLSNAGGGVVRFAAGTFDLGLEALRFQDLSNVSFEGAGIDATEIRNSNNGALDTEIFSFLRASRIGIRDMTLSARGTARTTSDTIDFDASSQNVIERVRVTASRGRGIVFDGKDIHNGVPLDAEGNVIRDCTVRDVPHDGIQLLAASRNRVERCTVTNAGRHGIAIVKSSATAAQPNKKSLENVISANVIQGSGDDGINITSSDRNELLGNIVVNSSSVVELGDGIKIASADAISCDANIVAGNSASDTREIKRQRYGLHIADALCAGNEIRENTFSGNRLGPIHDAGTDTIFTTSTDTEAPTAPGGLVATASDAKRVELTWDEATDNVAVAGYTIYRDGRPLTTVAASERAYADTTVSATTTYSYTVDAFDAVGNHSAESAPASATTPSGPTISTFSASADAYVNAELPESTFGSSAILRTDGEPIVRSYLRFDVSGIGGTRSKVTLRIFANTDSTGGFEVRTLSGSWDETVTYATSPAPADVVQTSGAFVAGRYVEVDVTTAVSGNGVVEFVLTGGDATAASYASRETATPPQLVVEWTG